MEEIKTDGMLRLVNGFNIIRKSLADETCYTKIDQYSELLKQFTNCKTEALEADRFQASEYNLFKVLKIQRREVVTHTPFISNLLNPLSAHAQGVLFYDAFINRFAKDRLSVFKEYDKD